MLKRFRHMIMLAIVLFSFLKAGAQMAMPDYVCVGATKHYHVNPNPVPGSTYTWKIDGVTQDASTTNEIDIKWSAAGTFTLSVQERSADGCLGPVQTGEVFVRQITLDVSGTNVDCPGGNNGTATVTATGGTAPYTYLWSDGQTTATAINLSAGTYTITVTDAKDCTSQASYTVGTTPDAIKPDFSLPNAFIECVRDLYSASYNDATMDISPDRPDYYTFIKGNKALDLDISKFVDNCPLTCPVEIRWKIDMKDGTRIPALPTEYLTGQPSTYTNDIQFLGDGINFTDMVHTITYWITDCSGNVSEPKTQTITVKPRPNILVVK